MLFSHIQTQMLPLFNVVYMILGRHIELPSSVMDEKYHFARVLVLIFKILIGNWVHALTELTYHAVWWYYPRVHNTSLFRIVFHSVISCFAIEVLA